MSMMATSTTKIVFRYELHQFIIPNVRPTGRRLGVGCYGNVEELEINGHMRAGKKISSTLVESEGVGILLISAKYAEGCQLMSSLRHPNIVQFIGLCFLPDYSLPVIVTEKLWTNLDSLLVTSTAEIPLTTKRSIIVDVARGLAFLHNHSPPIIHSHLSASTVLLNNDMVAKISDLEPALIVDLLRNKDEPFDTTLFGPEFDIFSFGHVALNTIQCHPLVHPANRLPREAARLWDYFLKRAEVMHRWDYIVKRSEDHPLVQLVEVCLSEEASCRPSADEVLQQLEAFLQAPCEYLTELDDLLREMTAQDEQGVNAAVDPEGRSSAEDADLEALPSATEIPRNECPICFVALVDDLHVTTCGHRFCHDCITKSLEQSHQCPICRRDLSVDPPIYTRRISSADVVEDVGNQQPPPRPRTRGQNQQQRQPRFRRQERRQSLMDCILSCQQLCAAVCCCLIGTIAPIWFLALYLLGESEDCPPNQSPVTNAFRIFSYVMFFVLCCQGFVLKAAIDHLDNLSYIDICTRIGCVVSVMFSVTFLGLLIAETVYVAEESDAIFGGYYTDNQTVIPCEHNLYSAPISLVGAYVVFISSNVVFGCVCVAVLCAHDCKP